MQLPGCAEISNTPKLTFEISHRPDGKMADVLASTLARTTAADASVDYRWYVPQRPRIFPSLRWETHILLVVCAGRRCLCREWHSFNRQLPSVFQPSYQCARSSSKVPIAPMGNSRFARCLQGGGVFVQGGSVTISSCTISGNSAYYVRAHPQKFPMPQWENC
jgi:hypothetical protein